MWGLVIQDFPRIIIHPSLDALNLSFTDFTDVFSLWNEAPNELVLIFTGPPFIRGKWPCEVHIRDGLQCFIKCAEFGTII